MVGLGNMGTPMSSKLLEAGYQVVGFDLSSEAKNRLTHAGGISCDTVTGVADCDVIILMLPSSEVVEAVLLKQGLAEVLAEGTVLVDMSSSRPMKTQEFAAILAAKGITLIDAPVSGGVKGAQSGRLSVMAGGDGGVVDALRPVLEVFGTVTHTGGVGSGHALKALNNLLSAVHLYATSEAMLTGIEYGLDPEVMLAVINKSSGRSGSTENKWPNFVLPETYNSGFSARLMFKDMRIAVDLSHQLGMSSDLGDKAVALWEAAVENLPEAADHTEIARWLKASLD